MSHFLVCCLCVWIFFVFKNLYVDTMNFKVPMDLSGIPWIFIYLLFLRCSLIFCITCPHFLWLRLWHVKAHGDLGATGLSYFFDNKRILCWIYIMFQFFLYFDCVFVFCLFTKINLLTKCISQHPWTSLKYRGYLYTYYSWGVPWYIAQHVHIFCGCVCDMSRPMVTWVHLIIFKKKWTLHTNEIWSNVCTLCIRFDGSLLLNPLFGEVCMCTIFMIWCLFGSVVSSKLWTWLISSKWPRPQLQEHEFLGT